MAETITFFQKLSWKIRYFLQYPPAAMLKFMSRTNRENIDGHHRGRFRTFQEAEAFLPVWRRSSFNNQEIMAGGIETFSEIHIFDWPVLFFLQQAINERKLHVVTDFGGHIGVKYHAFRNMLKFPEGLMWQVVDMPALVAEGKRRLTPDLRALKFFDSLNEAAPCDVLICSGVLQYIDTDIDAFFDALPSRPEMIILNKVGVSNRGGCVGLETHAQWELPNRVFTREQLADVRRRLGYKLVAGWTIPHRNYVLYDPKGSEEIDMIGEAWSLGAQRA